MEAIFIGASGLVILLTTSTSYAQERVVMGVPSQYLAQATKPIINRPTIKVGSQGIAVSELQAALKLLGYYNGVVDGIYSQSTANAVSQFQQAAGLNPNGVVSSETWQRLFPLSTTTTSSPSTSTNSAAAFPVPSTSQNPAVVTSPAPKPAATNSPKPNNTAASNAITATATPPQRSSNKPTATPPQRSSPSVNLPVLRSGMQGSAVTKLQQRLKTLGLFTGSVDGDFGPKTEAAVKAVQRRYRLNPDGVVGPTTWKVLLR